MTAGSAEVAYSNEASPRAFRMSRVLNERGEVAAEVFAKPAFVLAVPLQIDSVLVAQRFQQAVTSTLRASGRQAVMMDARQAAVSSPEVNESMWNWASKTPHFQVLAIVNQSSVLSVAAKMKALAMGAKKVRVFVDLDEATRWLTASDT